MPVPRGCDDIARPREDVRLFVLFEHDSQIGKVEVGSSDLAKGSKTERAACHVDSRHGRGILAPSHIPATRFSPSELGHGMFDLGQS